MKLNSFSEKPNCWFLESENYSCERIGRQMTIDLEKLFSSVLPNHFSTILCNYWVCLCCSNVVVFKQLSCEKIFVLKDLYLLKVICSKVILRLFRLNYLLTTALDSILSEQLNHIRSCKFTLPLNSLFAIYLNLIKSLFTCLVYFSQKTIGARLYVFGR